jgi:DNA-directed RNA polymerase subunit M/transcription elongation factor TFIIS
MSVCVECGEVMLSAEARINLVCPACVHLAHKAPQPVRDMRRDKSKQPLAYQVAAALNSYPVEE